MGLRFLAVSVTVAPLVAALRWLFSPPDGSAAEAPGEVGFGGLLAWDAGRLVPVFVPIVLAVALRSGAGRVAAGVPLVAAGLLIAQRWLLPMPGARGWGLPWEVLGPYLAASALVVLAIRRGGTPAGLSGRQWGLWGGAAVAAALPTLIGPGFVAGPMNRVSYLPASVVVVPFHVELALDYVRALGLPLAAVALGLVASRGGRGAAYGAAGVLLGMALTAPVALLLEGAGPGTVVRAVWWPVLGAAVLVALTVRTTATKPAAPHPSP
ncbi:hypothetical protein ACIBG7_22385 [Nonomuraea sp. NPDC050328]|uniref:hypothetical protein n=1 Tax=Nonomuraea sp. NPDC050328 TaxID=3364361 RepID=UPI0037884CC6